MKRREFVAASCFAGMASLSTLAQAEDSGGSENDKEYYELRLHRLDSKSKKDRLNGFLGDAAIPALNRIGVTPVGVFSPMEGDNQNVYVLLPHKSIESAVAATHRLLADAEYLKAGGPFLDAPLSDPAYMRIESSLLLAFDQMPKLQVPTKSQSRIFQLRTYESHSVKVGQKKIEMFNGGGELAIFRRVGLHPVFFGETLIGSRVPNLTYMLGFDDLETSEQNWGKFRRDPQWKQLRANPIYKDTVSNITNILLRPVSCSQI